MLLRSLLLLIAAFFTSGNTRGELRDDLVAKVTVYKQQIAQGTRYTYTVTNQGTKTIVGLVVGFDFYRGETQLEGARPIALQAPENWDSLIVNLEESNRFEIHWESGSPSQALAPGSSSSLFSVVVSQPNARYESVNWTVTINGPPVNASSRLTVVQGPTSDDTIAPALQVTLSPSVIWPPNKEMKEVRAVISVSDNTDQNPVIRLVSIICADCADPTNDIQQAQLGTDDRVFLVRADRTGRSKNGRVYVVRYSATDAAGNTAVTESTLTIPHDQRR